MGRRTTGLLLVWCFVFIGSACYGPSAQPPDAPSFEPQPSARAKAEATDGATDEATDGATDGATAGPVPDFAPLDEVRWHASLTSLAPDLPPLLTRILGTAAVEEDEGPYEDGSLVWMRDYHPMLVRQANGETRTVAYLAESRTRTALLNRRRTGKVEYAPADQHVPLIHENGNLVTNGRLVFVSDRILEDNAVDQTDALLNASGYRPRSPTEVVALLAAAVGRPRRDVIVLPSLPFEVTQHVDVWLMFLDEHTLIVPQVHGEGVARLPAAQRPDAEAVADFLDTQARDLEQRGLRVVRLPMLPPIIAAAADASEDPAEAEALFLTPANGLLIAHGGRRIAVLPEFDMQAIAPQMIELQQTYEQIWETELASLDWAVEFVDATTLVRQLGLVRCVTAPIPRIGQEGPRVVRGAPVTEARR